MVQVQNSLFSNIATTKIPAFYKENGETDYKEISVFLQLSPDDLAKIAKISVKTIRFSGNIPLALKERMEEMKNICELVFEMLGSIEKTQLWFKTKNQMLGNTSPRDLLRFGRYQKLLDVLMDIKNGNVP